MTKSIVLILTLILMIGLSPPVPGQASPTPAIQDHTSAAIQPAGTLDRLVESGVVAYLEVRDVTSQVETLRLIELWNEFWPLLYPKLGQDPKNGMMVEAVWSLIAPSLRGADVAVALWPDDGTTVLASHQVVPKSRIGIFIKFASESPLRHLLQTREQLDPLVSMFAGSPSDSGRPKLSFATVDDTLVIGDPSIVDRVAQSGPPTHNLGEDPDFRAARRHGGSVPLFLYTDLDLAVKLSEANRPPAPSGTQGRRHTSHGVTEALGSLYGDRLPKLAVGVEFHATQTLLKGLLLENGSQAGSAPGFSGVFKTIDSNWRAAGWYPPQADARVTVALDWPKIYDLAVPAVRDSISSQGGLKKTIVPLIENLVGQRLRNQLLPAFGSLSLSFDSLEPLIDLNGDDRNAGPGALGMDVLVKVNDRETIERTLHRLSLFQRKRGSKSGRDSERGVPINQLGQWHYAMTDDVLALSPGADRLRRMIGRLDSDHMLRTDPEFHASQRELLRNPSAWACVSPAAINQVSDRLRRKAMVDDSRIADMLAVFPTAFKPASMILWKDGSNLAAEVRLPEGLIPVVIASNIASNRAAVRRQAPH